MYVLSFSVNVCGFLCALEKNCVDKAYVCFLFFVRVSVSVCVCMCVSWTGFCIDPWPAVFAPLHSLFQMKADVLVL